MDLAQIVKESPECCATFNGRFVRSLFPERSLLRDRVGVDCVGVRVLFLQPELGDGRRRLDDVGQVVH